MKPVLINRERTSKIHFFKNPKVKTVSYKSSSKRFHLNGHNIRFPSQAENLGHGCMSKREKLWEG